MPESAPFPVESVAFSGAGDVLAGEAPADDVHEPSPGTPIKGFDVVPDGKAWQYAIPLPLEKDFPAIFVDLDRADAGMSEKDSAEDTSPGAGEEVEFTHFVR